MIYKTLQDDFGFLKPKQQDVKVFDIQIQFCMCLFQQQHLICE